MRRGSGIRRQVTASGILLGEVGREALVEALDWHVDRLPELIDEALGLDRLLAAFASEGQRQPDDDSLRALARDQLDEPLESGFAAGARRKPAFGDTRAAINTTAAKNGTSRMGDKLLLLTGHNSLRKSPGKGSQIP